MEKLLPNSSLVIQTDPLLLPRLKAYLEEVIDNLSLKTNNCNECMIYSKTNNCIEKTISDIYSRSHLYRYIHRFYIIQNTKKTFEWSDILKLIDEYQLDLNDICFRVLVYPRNEFSTISSIIPENVKLNPKNFSHILSVIINKNKNGEIVYDFGISPSCYFYNFEDVTLKVNKDSIVSRARYKLMEALERTKSNHILTKNAVALDIGASPGGWSDYLSEHVGTVYAVDPADLKIHKPNVKHFKMKIQAAIQELKDIKFDIVVCDMNEDAHFVIDLIKVAEKNINPKGLIILTCKFPKRKESNIGSRMELIVKHFEKDFKSFKILRVLHLLSNFNERCIIARKAVD